MLKITHPLIRVNQNQTQAQPGTEISKPSRSMQELLQIKTRIEEETKEHRRRTHEALAEMFLAGPLAWPDYPESDDLDWTELDEEWEDWIPLDCDQRADSSAGE